jgi:hypothetical protein
MKYQNSKKMNRKQSIVFLVTAAMAICIGLNACLAMASSTQQKSSSQLFLQERIEVRDAEAFERLRRDFTSQNTSVLPASQVSPEDIPATHVAYSNLSASHCVMGLIKSLTATLRSKPSDQLALKLFWDTGRELKFEIVRNSNKKFFGNIQNEGLPIAQSITLLGSNGVNQTYYRCMTQDFEVRGDVKDGYEGALFLLYRVP